MRSGIGFAVFACLMFTSLSHADTGTLTVPSQYLLPDARSRGMGGAFTAVAEGATVTWWNPGALGFNESFTIMPYSFVRPFPIGRDDMWFYSTAAAGAWDGIGLGAHVGYFRWGKSEATDASGIRLEEFTSHDYTIHVGGGVDLGRYLWSSSERLRWGVGTSLKIIRSALAPAIGGLEEASGTTVDFDLGTLVAYRASLPIDPDEETESYLEVRAGVVVRNVFDRSLKFVDGGAPNPLGGGPRFGVAVDCAVLDIWPWGHAIRGVLSLERSYQRDYTWNPDASGMSGKAESSFFNYADPAEGYGAEISLFGLLSARAGHVDDPDGNVSGKTWGFGAGGDFPRNVRVFDRVFGAGFNYGRWPAPGTADDVEHYEVFVRTGS